ncbi:MAG: TonB-dependent receptor [Methylococcales bacterium]|nr:TonB-dependent receptor [Methylococcales bacterium]
MTQTYFPFFTYLLVGGLAPMIAQAAQPPAAQPSMTVTATRTQRASDLASTTVITRQMLEQRQINSVEDALRGLAGINITNSGGLGQNTSVFIRGTESDQVLVMIDGIRVGSTTVGVTAFQDIPIYEIDSIEVIRGPRSSLYGTEAMGGIIHIHTRKAAQNTMQPEFSAGIGSHLRYFTSGGVSGQLDNSWYNINITHQESRGFNACNGGFESGCFAIDPDDDNHRNESGSIRLGHRFGDVLTLEATGFVSEGKTSFDGGPFSGNNLDFYQQVVGGSAIWDVNDFWTMTLRGGQSEDRGNNKFDRTFVSFFNTERISASMQNDFAITDDHLLSLGYDFLRDRVESTTAFTESARNNHAVFTQYQGRYDALDWVLGYRSDFNDQFNQFNTWNAAVGYQLPWDFKLTFAFGKAFKAPTFNELYFPGFGNAGLKPERSRSFELGLKGDHFGVNWAINGYYTYIDDLIAFDSFFLPENISQARIRGIEAMIASQWQGFDINLQLTHLNPENRESGGNSGKLLPRRAESTLRLDVDRRFGDVGVGVTVNGEGRRFDDLANTNKVSGFVTLDIRGEYQLHQDLLLQAKVNNLLNKHYQTVAGFNTDDLNFFFTLRYRPSF